MVKLGSRVLPGVGCVFEVELRILAVIFDGRLVIGPGSFHLVFEAAEIYLLSVDSQCCFPRLASFVEGDAFVLGEAFRSALAAVPAVLLTGGGP